MSVTPAPEPMGREPATVRVAMWSARHRWPVAALWFVATIGLLAVSLAMGGIDAADANANPNERQLEASEAYDLFNAGGPSDPYEQVIVVVGGAPGATSDPAFQTAVGDLMAALKASGAPLDGVQTPTFDELSDPFTAPPAAGLVSADGSTVRIIGRINGDDTRVTPLIAPVLPILADRPDGEPRARDPRDQQHVHQRRHQRADLRGPRRLAATDDPADVPDPAVRLRGDRRRGRAAGAGDHVARRGVRDPRHLQPGGRSRSAPTRRS